MVKQLRLAVLVCLAGMSEGQTRQLNPAFHGVGFSHAPRAAPHMRASPQNGATAALGRRPNLFATLGAVSAARDGRSGGHKPYYRHGGVGEVWGSGDSNSGGLPTPSGGNGVSQVGSLNGSNVGGANASGQRYAENSAEGVASDEHSSDPHRYCGWYAATAVNQSRRARATPSCSSFVQQAANLWSPKFQENYDLCVARFGSGKNADDNRERLSDLHQCVSH